MEWKNFALMLGAGGIAAAAYDGTKTIVVKVVKRIKNKRNEDTAHRLVVVKAEGITKEEEPKKEEKRGRKKKEETEE